MDLADDCPMKQEFIRWQEKIATPEQLTLSEDSQWNLFVDWYTD